MGRQFLRIALFLVGAVVIAPGWAADAVKVVVNGRPITGYDVEQRAALNELTGRPGGTEAATEELIAEAIERTEADRIGLTIPAAQVDTAYATIAARVRLTPEQLSHALTGRGVSPSTLKAQIHSQLVRQELLNGLLDRRRSARFCLIAPANAAPGCDLLFPAKPPSDQSAAPVSRYTLQLITFTITQGSSEEHLARRHREAEQFRARFAGCNRSMYLAKSFDGVSTREFGDLDSRQLNGPLGEAVKRTRAGDLTDPTPTERGIEMVAVCKITEVASPSRPRPQDRSLPEETVKAYMLELRARAVITHP
ncbi:MAG: peptidylprolyl isomerase [Bauldia sp.]